MALQQYILFSSAESDNSSQSRNCKKKKKTILISGAFCEFLSDCQICISHYPEFGLCTFVYTENFDRQIRIAFEKKNRLYYGRKNKEEVKKGRPGQKITK